MPISAHIGPSLVEDILLVRRFYGGPTGRRYEARSLPGHLLHWVLRGEVEQECGGQRQKLASGSVVWYYENEFVRGIVLSGPWVFYSVNFYAPDLAPPPLEQRHRPQCSDLGPAFKRLHAQWQAPAESARRSFLVHAALLEILAELGPWPAASIPSNARRELWWAVEAEYRRNPRHRVDLPGLAQAHGVSVATLLRACHLAVGTSPKRRLTEICLNRGRRLLQHTDHSVTHVAELLGYSRMHEFSRDYHRWFGRTPTEERRC